MAPTAKPASDLRWAMIALTVIAFCVLLFSWGCNTGPEKKFNDTRLSLTLTDYEILPKRIRMPAGLIRIEVKNTGRAVHGFRVVSDNEKRGGKRIRYTPAVPAVRPNESYSIDICLARGRYRIVGTLPGDEELGAVASLRLDAPIGPTCESSTK